LRVKKVRGFFWAIEVPKKNTNFQKILTKLHSGELPQKRYNFAACATNHTHSVFFLGAG